eukprot:TRINITY_DN9604_c0_g2_i1.p1 TRINITY_DN9604_c0_g2~~TRINITY_DN9604_c0_g2_i1.p1  ORF type:complete len:535 (+),score=172.45 TRINITY_DN9604_c0_g2_i1:99-1607(+)
MAADCKLVLDNVVKEQIAGKIDAAPGQHLAGDFECPICTFPAFATPVKTRPCEHLHHKGCLEDWLENKVGDAHSCPQCRKRVPAGRKAFAPASRYEKAVLQGLEVECPLRCGEPARKRMRFDALDRHVREQCPNAPMLCSGEGCGVTNPRKQIQYHVAQCPHVRVACKQCKGSVKRGRLQVHMKDECRVACEYCKAAFLYHKRKEHEEKDCTGSVPVTAFAALRKEKEAELEQRLLLSQRLQSAEKDITEQSQRAAFMTAKADRQCKLVDDVQAYAVRQGQRANLAGAMATLQEERALAAQKNSVNQGLRALAAEADASRLREQLQRTTDEKLRSEGEAADARRECEGMKGKLHEMSKKHKGELSEMSKKHKVELQALEDSKTLLHQEERLRHDIEIDMAHGAQLLLYQRLQRAAEAAATQQKRADDADAECRRQQKRADDADAERRRQLEYADAAKVESCSLGQRLEAAEANASRQEQIAKDAVAKVTRLQNRGFLARVFD